MTYSETDADIYALALDMSNRHACLAANKITSTSM